MSHTASVERLASYLEHLARPPVVLVGLCSQGLAILRSLTAHHVPVVVVDAAFDRPSARTKYGVKVRCMDADGPGLIDTLELIGRRSPHRPVLILTTDAMLRTVNRAREGLSRYFEMPVPCAPLLAAMIDKQELAKVATQQGLATPRTWTFDMGAHGSGWDHVLAEATFPAVIKPATPLSAFKALTLQTPDDLVRVVARYAQVRRFVLQQWIEGGDDRVVFVAYYFDREAKARAAFCGQKIRQYPRFVGAASSAHSLHRPDLIEEGLRVFEGLGYCGLGSVEFKLDPAGRPFFIEATVGRMDYWIKTAIANGVDLPAIVYRDLSGVPIEASATQCARRTWVDTDRDWPVYWESWFDPHCSKRGLIRFLFTRKTYALFDWRDPAPFVYSWASFLRAVVAALARRLKPATAAGRTSVIPQ